MQGKVSFNTAVLLVQPKYSTEKFYDKLQLREAFFFSLNLFYFPFTNQSSSPLSEQKVDILKKRDVFVFLL
jgi:hypothetical protein